MKKEITLLRVISILERNLSFIVVDQRRRNLPYKEDDKFDYTSFLPWADGIQERVKEHINNKFKN